MKQQIISFFVAMVVMASCFGLSGLFGFWSCFSRLEITLLYLLFSAALWVWFIALLFLNHEINKMSKGKPEA